MNEMMIPIGYLSIFSQGGQRELSSMRIIIIKLYWDLSMYVRSVIINFTNLTIKNKIKQNNKNVREYVRDVLARGY